jgi:hypothetical protein
MIAADRPTSRAAHTSDRLQRAALGGVPEMIPGAREQRRSPPGAPSAETGATPLEVPAVRTVDRARLEYEREGGGAPSQRT